MSIFDWCKHDYELVTEKYVESEWERLLKIGIEKLNYYPETKGKHIVILKCKKCGNIKKIVTRV